MLSSIKVGRNHEIHIVCSVRTVEQREAVEKIVQRDDFDFACCNPFDEEVGSYTGPFTFVYFTKRGDMRTVRFGKRGKILSQSVVTAERAKELGEEAVRKYEDFQSGRSD